LLYREFYKEIDDVNEVSQIFNEFRNNEDIDDFIDDSSFVDQVMIICLLNGFETFAM